MKCIVGAGICKQENGVVYGSMGSEPKKRRMVGGSLGDVLRPVEKPEWYIEVESLGKRLLPFLDWLVCENTCELNFVWQMLMFMYTSPEFRRRIQENTEPALYSGYFDKFMKRMTHFLCGNVEAKKNKKRARTNVAKDENSLAPIQIVLEERLFFSTLQKSTL